VPASTGQIAWREPCSIQQRPDAVLTARSTSTTIAEGPQRSAPGPSGGSCGGWPWPWLVLSPARGEGDRHSQGARSACADRL